MPFADDSYVHLIVLSLIIECSLGKYLNIDTIVINHVTGVYLIPVIKEMVTVQTNLDVNLDGSIYRPNNISVI